MQITLTINHQADTTEALADFGRKLMQMFGSLSLAPSPAPAQVANTVENTPSHTVEVSPGSLPGGTAVVFPVANGGGASGVSAPLASVAVETPVATKRPRGRPPLVQAETPAPAPAPAAVVVEAAPALAARPASFFEIDPIPASAEPAVTEADARLAFIELARTPGGEAAVAEVMANFRVTKWAAVAPESFGAIQRALMTAKIQLDANNRAGVK